MPIAVINQDANSAFQLDRMLQKIQLGERKLHGTKDIVQLISIVNELGTDLLDALCYHRLFDKILSVMQHYRELLTEYQVVIDSIYGLCARVLCRLVINSENNEEISGIHNPSKAVFFNLQAYQITNQASYLLEALVFSTRDDYNLEYLVQVVKPHLAQLQPAMVLDCLVMRSNYRAQEYYFEALLHNDVICRDSFMEALAQFKPGCDITRLLQMLLQKTTVEGCWQHILRLSQVIDAHVVEQLIMSLAQSDLGLDDLRSITEYVLQCNLTSNDIIKMLMYKTRHPNDNPNVFELLRRMDPIDRDAISLNLAERFLVDSAVEMISLIPLVRAVPENQQVARIIWKHFHEDRDSFLDTLPFANSVLVHICTTFEASPDSIIKLYARIEDDYPLLKQLCLAHCTYEMLVKLVSLLEDASAKELEELVGLMQEWITDPQDQEAIARKLAWHAQGLLDKHERSRILSLLSIPTAPVESVESEPSSNNTNTTSHHLLAFNTFHEDNNV